MECRNDEELRVWLEGGCDEATASAVEAHIDRCRDCHALIAAIAKIEVPVGDRFAGAPVLQRGASFGRYRVLDVLGAGAMGVVYAARDEALDRTVAIKLLGSAHDASAEAAARLEREAQAMARLSHPNVVAVYEIGTYQGTPFVAMEHVDGVTLSDWLHERRPPIDEVVRLFREAAIGLEAVHRAGLVHRDFKPANVLVSRDGRVRIADFGLVHLIAEAPLARPSGNAPTASRVTAEGAVIGTPAYLAPEQREGQVDARSDQFSFCAALFEACFDRLPFAAATLDELGTAVRSGALQLPKVLPRGTRWLVPILRRGLAYDPAARFPDLGALVAALSRSPARTRRWVLTGVGTLAGVSGLILGLAAARRPNCSTVEHALAGIWDAPRRQAVHDAFLSRQRPAAARAWETVSTALDAYAASWVGRRREACLQPGKDDATRALVAARVACLDRHLAELHTLSDLLASSDVDATESAPQAVMDLRSPDSCEREVAGARDLTKDEQSVLERLTEVRLLSLVGRQKAALDRVRTILPESEHARPAIRAKALLRSGQLEIRHSLETGVAQLRQAALLAETAREDEVRAEALADLAYAMSQLTAPSDLALGLQYVEQASAVLARLGGDHRLGPLVLIHRGHLLRASGRFDEAVAQLDRVLEMLERDPARDWRLQHRTLMALGITLAEMGRPADAVPPLQRALALQEDSVGPRSPAVFVSLLNLGEALLDSGRVAEATPYLERAAALAEITQGSDSRPGVSAALALAKCRAEQGDTTATRSLLERALAISSTLAAGDHMRFEAQLALGQYLAKNGDSARARALLEQALRDGPTSQEETAKARFALAQALPRAERKRALELAQQARATYAQAGPRREKEVAAIDAWVGKN